MTRSLGDQLPDGVRRLLDGSDLAAREGLTFLLLSTDEAGWPHLAMLSVGEVVAVDSRTVRVGLWLYSGTTRNLARSGRATLAVVADGNGYYLRAKARRGADLDLGTEGRLACFALEIEDVEEDSADYASLTSGVTFRLKQPEQVIPRWQHTVDALRAAAA
ncbi:MAG TPA: pyridoxamine 5'-phosphate oxidase family protein [Chloroflexota bacterium]